MQQKVMQSSAPPVFRMPLGNGNDEVAIGDAKPFNVIIVSDASRVTFTATYSFNSRQYTFYDVLPSTAVIEVIQ